MTSKVPPFLLFCSGNIFPIVCVFWWGLGDWLMRRCKKWMSWGCGMYADSPMFSFLKKEKGWRNVVSALELIRILERCCFSLLLVSRAVFSAHRISNSVLLSSHNSFHVYFFGTHKPDGNWYLKSYIQSQPSSFCFFTYWFFALCKTRVQFWLGGWNINKR